MEVYNKLMQYVWLIIGAAMTGYTTYKCLTEDPKLWSFYYVFAGIAFAMYFFKRYMIKRMNRHHEYLQNKEKDA